MALNYVSLTCDLFDGQGNALSGGTATFAPNVQLTDATDHEIIPQAPVTAAFKPTSSPVVKLLATDNSAPAPNGWKWTVTFTGVSGSPASFSFFLPFSGGASQNLSALAPVSGAVPATITNIDGGSAVTGQVPAGSFDGGSASG